MNKSTPERIKSIITEITAIIAAVLPLSVANEWKKIGL
jgi:hypothetical protein